MKIFIEYITIICIFQYLNSSQRKSISRKGLCVKTRGFVNIVLYPMLTYKCVGLCITYAKQYLPIALQTVKQTKRFKHFKEFFFNPYLPVFVMIISVPMLWNLLHKSRLSRLILMFLSMESLCPTPEVSMRLGSGVDR